MPWFICFVMSHLFVFLLGAYLMGRWMQQKLDKALADSAERRFLAQERIYNDSHPS